MHEQSIEDTIASVDHGLLRNGTKEKISELLQQQIDVNCINEDGDTVLHSILRNEKLVQKDVVKFLTLCLARGVNPNKRDRHGETALHLAIERRMKEAVSCLLEYSADIHVRDKKGNGISHFFIEDEYEKLEKAILYPLMNTTENREITQNCSLDFASFLVDVGVDFDRKNATGVSALPLAITYNMYYLVPALMLERKIIKGYEKSTQNFLPDLSTRSSSPSAGKTSVYNAKYHTKSRHIIVSNSIKAKALCLLDLLRELAKISIDFELTNGENPLNMIVEQLDCKDKSSVELRKDVVELLTRCLAQGVDLNSQNEHIENERKMKEAVDCLLDYAAGMDVVDQNGNGIAHFFIENEYEKKMTILFPLISAPKNREITEHCSRDIASFLLDIGVDFAQKNKDDKSALDLAIMYNLLHLLPVLLEHPNVKPNYEKLIENVPTEISSDQILIGTPNYDTISLMLLDGGRFDNSYGLTFLSTAIRDKREMSCIQTMINHFLSKCGDVDFATNMFEELTSTCSCWSDSNRAYFSSVLLDLVASGVDINKVEICKRLFRTAIKTQNIWLLEFLRKNGGLKY